MSSSSSTDSSVPAVHHDQSMQSTSTSASSSSLYKSASSTPPSLSTSNSRRSSHNNTYWRPNSPSLSPSPFSQSPPFSPRSHLPTQSDTDQKQEDRDSCPCVVIINSITE